MTNNVKASIVLELLLEGGRMGKREIEITFYPPYNESEHSNLPPKLKKILQKPKISVFNIIEEATAILELSKSEYVSSIRWI